MLKREDKISTSVNLPLVDYDKIKTYCVDSGRTMSWFIKKATDYFWNAIEKGEVKL